MNQLDWNTRPWQFRIRYEWWHRAIVMYFGDYYSWQWARFNSLPDQHKEDVKDMLGTYCMGGEL